MGVNYDGIIISFSVHQLNLHRAATLNNVIKQRLESMTSNLGNYTEIPGENLDLECIYVRRSFFNGPLGRLCIYHSIGDKDPEEILNILHRFPIDDTTRVELIWPSYKSGIILLYKDFVENYDDLWCPSSDDLWVTDQDHQWLLEIDHEENVNFYPKDN